MTKPRNRSSLSREDARSRYLQLAETALLAKIRLDALRLDREDDERRVAVGPFARLNAEEVAASADGKSRGAITEPLQEPAPVSVGGDGPCPRRPECRCIGSPGSAGVRRTAGMDRSGSDSRVRARAAPWHGAGRELRHELGPVAQPGAIWRLERADRGAEHAWFRHSAERSSESSSGPLWSGLASSLVLHGHRWMWPALSSACGRGFGSTSVSRRNIQPEPASTAPRQRVPRSRCCGRVRRGRSQAPPMIAPMR